MNIKTKLIIMNFLQFFIWGAWLITIGTYWFETKHWDGSQFGLTFGMLGFASLISPTLAGIIADKWINAEKLYAILHFISACFIVSFIQVDNPDTFKWYMLGAMFFYMPTISLSFTISYNLLKNNGGDVIKDFPPIRVFGTVGFILAMWVTNLSQSNISANQFIISAIASLVLVAFTFMLPACKPNNVNKNETSVIKMLGLDAFKLFLDSRSAIFLLFSILLGAALQLTNMYGDSYLNSFDEHSITRRYSGVILSISQISEALFILAIPFFLKRFGIKKVMFISMIAWVIRFGLFAYGSDSYVGMSAIIISCIVYGMAFDFFNISGSLFLETTTEESIRSSAQGLFMMMTNGIGAIIGSYSSGFLIDQFFTHNGEKDWHSIWLSFSAYSLVIAILFWIFFKYEHKPEEQKIDSINH